MRGTRRSTVTASIPPGFIPAYAGNTLRRFHGGFQQPVHPRVCGEHDGGHMAFAAVGGSSPRMRGTRFDCWLWTSIQRFIPAYAGNTVNDALGIGAGTVHPRVCGEHESCRTCLQQEHGSSPRMRGTLYRTRNRTAFRRFIPAYAGNTCSGSGAVSQSSVHPRVCGKHNPATLRSIEATGSSPRMRGTLSGSRCGGGERRFIPAYAGNTTFPAVNLVA